VRERRVSSSASVSGNNESDYARHFRDARCFCRDEFSVDNLRPILDLLGLYQIYTNASRYLEIRARRAIANNHHFPEASFSACGLFRDAYDDHSTRDR
jgi:hypothetical protein